MWRVLAFFLIVNPSHALTLSCPPGAKQSGESPPYGLAVACLKPDGGKQGPFLTWHETGKQKQLGFYSDNKAQGQFSEWYDTGVKKSEGEFDKGEMNGFWLFWYPSGQKKIQGMFNRGVQGCPWHVWTDTGHEDNSDTRCGASNHPPSPPLTLAQHRGFLDCGVAVLPIAERILDCAAKNGDISNWNDLWKLVTRDGLYKEVWQDQKTGFLWSSLVFAADNWCHAMGSSDPGDPSGYCNNKTYQDQATPIGYCTSLKSHKNNWKLPTKEDYQQANSDSIRSIMPDMGTFSSATSEWTATIVTGVPTDAWVFFGAYGYMYKFIRTNSAAVRCVSR